MKHVIKIIIISVIIGFVAFPTIIFGGTFVSSLVQGKTVNEAIQILAEQLDILIGRVEMVEVKQVEQEEIVFGLQSTIDQQKETIEKQKNLIGELQSLQETHQKQLTKENACRRMNELKIAPHETKIAYYTEQSNKPVYASWAPDTTKELLEYLHGYMKAGGPPYLHNPDYALNLVEKYIPILENRWQEYLIQKEICEQP